jgi:hypothetical protein
MRPLCGAIIVAGAMIGLGLTAIGFGARYHTGLEKLDKEGNPILLHLWQMDKPLVFIMVFLSCVAILGLGIAFLGLAYHHQKRHLEWAHANRHGAPRQPASG